jgi:hypothetical protein
MRRAGWLWLGRTLGLVVVVTAFGVVGSSAAGAGPSRQGDCVEVMRRKLYLPETVASDDELFEWAFNQRDDPDEIPAGDSNLKGEYCRNGQGWKKNRDDFPYDDPDICVTINPTEGETPREITPLTDINDWGVQPLDMANTSLTYCREGNTWKRRRGPNEPAEGCVRIVRNKYQMPQTIQGTAGAEFPSEYGSTPSTSYDTRFLLTYCDPEEDGSWVRSGADPFPYDQADLCVDIFYDPDEHGGVSPPDEITPLNEIDEYGHLDGSGGLYGTENIEHYCKSGDKWTRGARADDYPEGDWRDWADGDCVTIVPNSTDLPRRTDQHPELLGQVLDDNPFDNDGVRLQYVDVRSLKTYCPHDGKWYRVDDYPLEEIIGDDAYRLNDPGQGTCVVIVADYGMGLPESIVPPGHPADYGSFVSRDDYESHPEYEGDELPLGQMYCFINGVWRRGDKLDEGCAGQEDPHIVRPEGLFPDRCWGRFPTSNYDIGYDGGAWDNFSRKLYGWWTDFFFGIGKGATTVALWATDWAYTFDITKYSDLGLDIGHDYEVHLTHNAAFRLEELAFLVLVAYVAIMILRRKGATAGGELAMSIALMALVGVLLANRGDYMRSIWDVMDRSSKDILVAGQGEDPATYEGDARKVLAEAEAEIHQVLVEDPYDFLNWGHRLDGKCAEARNEIVALGPWGDADEPREMMGEADCDREVEFNEVPNITRMLGAILMMVAAVLVALLLMSVALTVVLAKFVTLALFALLPFIALAVMLPAGGRRVAWLAGAVVLQAVLAVMGTSLVLSMLVMALRRLMEATEEVSIIERFGVMVLVVLLAREARKRLLASGQSSAGRLADNMTNSFRLGGGGAPWQGPRGSGGVDFLAADRGLNRTMATGMGVGYRAFQWGVVGAGVIGGMASQSWHRHRTGKIGLRNLREMERYKERRDGLPGTAFPRGFNRLRDRGSRGPRGGGGGSGPAGGAGIGPGGPSGPRPGGGGGGGAPHPAPSGAPIPSARDRAIEALNRPTPVPAQRYTNFREHRYWQGVHRAEQRYAKDVQLGIDPRFARDSFAAKIQKHGSRYERMTGQVAPMAREPWAGGPPGGPALTTHTPSGPTPAPPTAPNPGGGQQLIPPRPGQGPNPGSGPASGSGAAPRGSDPYAPGGTGPVGAAQPRGFYERTADASHRLGERIAERGRRLEERWEAQGSRIDWRQAARPAPPEQQTWLHNHVTGPVGNVVNRIGRRMDRVDGAAERAFPSDFHDALRRREDLRARGDLRDED